MYEIIDFNDDVYKIVGKLEENSREAALTREKIKKLKERQSRIKQQDEIKLSEQKEKSKDITEYSDTKDEVFESEVDYYLQGYQYLKDNFTIEELISVLPKRENYYYEDILMRLMSESVKNIFEYYELASDGNASDKKEMLYEISCEQKKINALKNILNYEEKIEEPLSNNKIILVPNYNGDIRIINDLKGIDSTYYSSFLELINSIIDGSFKGIKRFKNNNALTGVLEVRGYQVRIIFDRLNTDTYGLITAFIKKSDNDRGYREFIKGRIAEYRYNFPKLQELIKDENFLELNDENIQELFNILGDPKEKGEVKKND